MIRDLINNDFHYYLGKTLHFLDKYVAVIFMVTSVFRRGSYFFNHYHERHVMRLLLAEDVLKVNLENWRNHRVEIKSDSVEIYDKRGRIILCAYGNNRLKDKVINKYLDYEFKQDLHIL